MHRKKQVQRLALIALIVIALGMSHLFEQKVSAAEDIRLISYNPLRLNFVIEEGEEQFLITYIGEDDAQIVQKETTREKCLRNSGLCYAGITFPTMVRQIYRGIIEAKDAEGTLLRTFDAPVIQTVKPAKVKVTKIFPRFKKGKPPIKVELYGNFFLFYSTYGGSLDAELAESSKNLLHGPLFVRVIRPDGKRTTGDFSCRHWDCSFSYKTKMLGQHQFQLTYFGSFGKNWSRTYTFDVIEAK